ncbi:MAG: substrate-binding domain-containing protein [Lentisphaerae bacterium]|nr:substrate-binding domain-containing protein [Lentisphaerota bacterium]
MSWWLMPAVLLVAFATLVGAAPELQLGVIPKSTGGEFWETVEKGARQAAADLHVTIRWEGTVTETETAEQNKIIENMVNLGVSGLAVAPLNKAGQRKQIEHAVKAGIPVVVFDSAVDGNAHASYVATDNTKAGALGGQHLVSLLGPAPAKVMCMRFSQGTGSTEARAAGFIDTIKAAGHAIVADPYPDTGTVEGCKTTAANTLEQFVKNNQLDLDGIFACNLYSALGVASALDDLRKAGIQTHVKFVGFDTSKKLVEDLQGGRIDALVAQDPQRMGYLAVETLVKVVRGEAVPPVIDTGAVIVTKQGLDADPAVRKLVGLE